jgi:hypothetical protein
MADTYTLPGVLLTGIHSARPAASAVASGTLYAETDTGQTYQSDGVSTWTAWGAAIVGGSLEVKEVDGSPDVTGVTQVIVSNGTLTDNGGGSVTVTTGGGGGGGGCLGAISYSSGSDSVWQTTSSSSSADIDATNAAMTITVPASGKFLVTIQVLYQNTVSAGVFYLDVRTGSTVIGSAAVQASGSSGVLFGGNFAENHPVMILCTGQTPGSLAIKAGFRISAGTANVYANDAAGGAGHVYGPFVMAAWAA